MRALVTTKKEVDLNAVASLSGVEGVTDIRLTSTPNGDAVGLVKSEQRLSAVVLSQEPRVIPLAVGGTALSPNFHVCCGVNPLFCVGGRTLRSEGKVSFSEESWCYVFRMDGQLLTSFDVGIHPWRIAVSDSDRLYVGYESSAILQGDSVAIQGIAGFDVNSNRFFGYRDRINESNNARRPFEAHAVNVDSFDNCRFLLGVFNEESRTVLGCLTSQNDLTLTQWKCPLRFPPRFSTTAFAVSSTHALLVDLDQCLPDGHYVDLTTWNVEQVSLVSKTMTPLHFLNAEGRGSRLTFYSGTTISTIDLSELVMVEES